MFENSRGRSWTILVLTSTVVALGLVFVGSAGREVPNEGERPVAMPQSADQAPPSVPESFDSISAERERRTNAFLTEGRRIVAQAPDLGGLSTPEPPEAFAFSLRAHVPEAIGVLTPLVQSAHRSAAAGDPVSANQSVQSLTAAAVDASDVIAIAEALCKLFPIVCGRVISAVGMLDGAIAAAGDALGQAASDAIDALESIGSLLPNAFTQAVEDAIDAVTAAFNAALAALK